LGLLREAGLLGVVLPEVAALDGVAQPPEFHPEGDVLTHTRMMLDGYREGGETVALAALLHDVGKARTATVNPKGRIAFPDHAPVGAGMAVDILERLRYPSRTVAQVETLVARHMDWHDLRKMRAAKQRRFLLRDDFDAHLELHRLDCEACHGDLSLHRFAREERARLAAEPPPARPLANGDDLVRMGFRPGPAFRTMLDALLDAQLEGTVRTREEAVAFLERRYRPPTGKPLAEGGGA
jgi:poly(A) polymerase